ncbi:hypothetical protein Agub_g11727, partial [Astrephomene gubernaculifera]
GGGGGGAALGDLELANQEAFAAFRERIKEAAARCVVDTGPAAVRNGLMDELVEAVAATQGPTVVAAAREWRCARRYDSTYQPLHHPWRTSATAGDPSDTANTLEGEDGGGNNGDADEGDDDDGCGNDVVADRDRDQGDRGFGEEEDEPEEDEDPEEDEESDSEGERDYSESGGNEGGAAGDEVQDGHMTDEEKLRSLAAQIRFLMGGREGGGGSRGSEGEDFNDEHSGGGDDDGDQDGGGYCSSSLTGDDTEARIDIAPQPGLHSAGRGDTTNTGHRRCSSDSTSTSSATHNHHTQQPVPLGAGGLAIAAVDVTQAQATVAADYDFILGLIRAGLGVEVFNRVLQEQLNLRLRERLLVQAWSDGDHRSAAALLAGGARCLSPVLELTFPGPRAARRCSPTLAAALRCSGGVQDLRLRCRNPAAWRRYLDGDVVAFVVAEALAAATPGISIGQLQGSAANSNGDADVTGDGASNPNDGLGLALNAGGGGGGGVDGVENGNFCGMGLRSLSWCLPVGPLGCRALGEALCLNTRLTDLRLEGYWFREETMEPLVAALAAGNRSIVKFRLFGGELGHRGAERLCDWIRANPALVHLELVNGGLTDLQLPALVAAILAAGRLQHLNLLQNLLTPASGPALEALLAGTATLRFLNVGNGGGLGLGAEGYAAVSRGLGRNQSLEELHCPDVGPEGLRALLRAFRDPAARCRGVLREVGTMEWGWLGG